MSVMRNTINCLTRRCYSNRKLVDTNSNSIRQKFLEYFVKDNEHTFIRSSPVVPFCDPTLSFVNAGMNQFKGVFLGNQNPPALKVANSQKCVRVGGKHNDLNVVGTDGFHHTFFEMLGNWSFGDYFKQEACQMAWILLTDIYDLHPKSLYVTYFGGDKHLGLEPDYECKEIWRSIGVSETNILPFGCMENFWEMGLSGPCGPCTEIHVDHTKSNNRAMYVNQGLPDLTELWNIVFIQYNRNPDGLITLLPKQHVDTGMGFERLTTLLQRKNNNYETDLFLPIIKSIEKMTYCRSYEGKFGKDDPEKIDTAYRILADHSRMISACLADGMIPEQNHKLRKIIRKALLLSRQVFSQKEDFLWRVCEQAIHILGSTYPEMLKNSYCIEQILKFEEDSLYRLHKESSTEWFDVITNNPDLESLDIVEVPGIMLAYRELKNLEPLLRKNGLIPGEVAFKLYDTYGLDETKIQMLSKSFDLEVDLDDFKIIFENWKQKSKQSSVNFNTDKKYVKLIEKFKMENIMLTDDSPKYKYEFLEDRYVFEDVNAKVVKIIVDGEDVSQTDRSKCSILFDKTSFYYEAGGQSNDIGSLLLENGLLLNVNDAINIQGYVIHNVISDIQENYILKVGDQMSIKLNKENRLGNMRNHTATHLLNSVIQEVVKPNVTSQKSSKVTSKELRFNVNIYGKRLCTEDVEIVERYVNRIISKKSLVETKMIDSQQLFTLDNVTLLPGETYPDSGIRIVNIVDEDRKVVTSCEACCGTHVKNTSHIEGFCVTNFMSTGRGSYSFRAVTGDEAKYIQKKGKMFEKSLRRLCKNIENEEINNDYEQLLTEKINRLNKHEDQIPYTVKMRSLDTLNKLKSDLTLLKRSNLREFINMEMNTIVEQCKKTNKLWLVHYLQCSSMLDSVPLQKATRTCQDLPVIVISYIDGEVKARCCVPQKKTTENFNAQKWLQTTVGNVFQSTVAAPKGQDPNLICNMKSRKVKKNDWEGLLRDAVTAANTFAAGQLK